MTMPPFHLAFPVRDLASTERFYVDVLGCAVGRRDARWTDFDRRLPALDAGGMFRA